MSKGTTVKKTGQVIEALPNARFLVKLTGEEITMSCYLAGKMMENKIKVLVGDKVDLEFPPTLHIKNAIGRITFRNK